MNSFTLAESYGDYDLPFTYAPRPGAQNLTTDLTKEPPYLIDLVFS